MGLVAVTADRNGNVMRGFDLFRLFELEENERGSVELGGFAADDEGNLLFTAPVLFRAFVISPSGEVKTFGKPGSAPGKFNIVGGIARDPRGNFLVIDRLKGAVLVFDSTFNFITQFSTRGYKPGELIFPDSVAVDDRSNVFVTQAGRRGISVFKLTYP
jgi:DNA-binding beta-propeller fold protein YncE